MMTMKPKEMGGFPRKPFYRGSLTLLTVLLVNSCGAADLVGDNKKSSNKREVTANQSGDEGGGAGEDSVEIYGTTADGKRCLKLTADNPSQSPGQTPGQNPSPPKGKDPPKNPPKDTKGNGTEPGPVPPCGPTQSGKGGDIGPGKSKADIDVNVDINKNGNGQTPPGGPGPNQPCVGPLCIFVGVGVGKGGSGCYGPQCPNPAPPGGEPPPPPPGGCPGGSGAHQGKLWNKWSQWKKGTC